MRSRESILLPRLTFIVILNIIIVFYFLFKKMYHTNKTKSFCVGGRHFSSTASFESDRLKKVEDCQFANVLIVSEKKSMSICDDTSKLNVYVMFLKTLEKLQLKQVQNWLQQ